MDVLSISMTGRYTTNAIRSTVVHPIIELEPPWSIYSTRGCFRQDSWPGACTASNLHIRLCQAQLRNIHGDQSGAVGIHPVPVAASQSIPALCTTVYFRASRVRTWQSRRIDRHAPRVSLLRAMQGALISNPLPHRRDAGGMVSISALPIGLRPSLTKRSRNRAGHVPRRHLPRRGSIMPSIRPPTAAEKAAPIPGTTAEATLRLPETGFLRQPQVLSFVPFSKSTLWRRIQANTFPHPVKLSERVTVWRAEDIRRWIAEQGG